MRRTPLAVLAAAAALTASACGTASHGATAARVTLRLGYFPNVTHAPALVGFEQGHFATALGPEVALRPVAFGAGPEAVEALNAESIDAAFLGPSPTINLWSKSRGRAIVIVAGATSGGASLVVQPSIRSAADLRGGTVASPQLGGTQDVALRSWLLAHGLKTDRAGGGDVAVAPQANGETIAAFRAGDLDGAWVPEPWATRLVRDGGTRLVDEQTIWPDGRFVTTHLVAAQTFLRAHPDVVRRLVDGLIDTVDAIVADPAAARRSTNDGIARAIGRRLDDALIEASWERLTFTVDPVTSSLAASAAAARAVGLLGAVDLDGIYDLTMLDALLAARDRKAVTAP